MSGIQGPLKVSGWSETFKRDYRKAPVSVQAQAREILGKLEATPSAQSLRLHPLNSYRPTIYKIDVFTNRSWQISFNLEGTEVTLRRLSTHKAMDRNP